MRILHDFLGMDSRDRPFVALVSPSVRELLPDSWRSLNAFLKSEGALSVHPVDAGIPEFARRSAVEAARRGPGLHILSACPAATRYIETRHPAFRACVLGVPSPMAILSEAIHATAKEPRGDFVLSVTPCSHKRLEADGKPSSFRVLELDLLLAALERAGIALSAHEGMDYDTPPPTMVNHCGIDEAVADRARELGHKARAVKLDGEAAADVFFTVREKGIDEVLPVAGPGEYVFLELSFCEGGCSRLPRSPREGQDPKPAT